MATQNLYKNITLIILVILFIFLLYKTKEPFTTPKHCSFQRIANILVDRDHMEDVYNPMDLLPDSLEVGNDGTIYIEDRSIKITPDCEVVDIDNMFELKEEPN